MGSFWLQKVFHKRVVLARFCHRNGKYVKTVSDRLLVVTFLLWCHMHRIVVCFEVTESFISSRAVCQSSESSEPLFRQSAPVEQCCC